MAVVPTDVPDVDAHTPIPFTLVKPSHVTDQSTPSVSKSGLLHADVVDNLKHFFIPVSVPATPMGEIPDVYGQAAVY